MLLENIILNNPDHFNLVWIKITKFQSTSTNSDHFNLIWIEIMKLNIKVKFIELNLNQDLRNYE